MGGFVCLAILEIGRVQLRCACVVIVQPLVPQRFEIQEVSGIFLDRPFALGPAGEEFWWQSVDRLDEAFRHASKSLQKFGSDLHTEAKLKLAVKPALWRRHFTSESEDWN